MYKRQIEYSVQAKGMIFVLEVKYNTLEKQISFLQQQNRWVYIGKELEYE